MAKYFLGEWEGRWNECPDLYAIEHTFGHLTEAIIKAEDSRIRRDLISSLILLLTDLSYLEAKAVHLGVNSMLADFHTTLDMLPPTETDAVAGLYRALRLSAHAIARDPHQLPGQIVGRLVGTDMPQLHKLVEEASRWDRVPWLRPTTASLEPPRGLLRTLGEHTGALVIAALPDSRHAISASLTGTLKTWELEQSGETQAISMDSKLSEIAITPDGRNAIAVCNSREGNDTVASLVIWNLKGRDRRHQIPLEGFTVNRVIAMPDNRHAMTVTVERENEDAFTTTYRVWDIEAGELLRSASLDLPLPHSDMNSTGSQVIAASYMGVLCTWSPQKGDINNIFVTDMGIWQLKVTPDGLHAITSSVSRITNDLGFEDVRRIMRDAASDPSVGEFIDQVDLFQERGQEHLPEQSAHVLTIWHLATGKALRTLRGHKNRIDAIAVTSDGRFVVSGSWDRTLKVWDFETGREVATLIGHAGKIRAVTLTPDGRRVISAADDGTLKVWELSSSAAGETTTSVSSPASSHVQAVSGLALRKPQVLSGSADGDVKIWDYVKGVLERTYQGPSHAVSAVAAVQEDDRFLCGFADGTIRILDPHSNSYVGTLEGHSGAVTALASVSGSGAVSSSEDGTLRLWDLKTSREVHSIIVGKVNDWSHVQDPVVAMATTPDGRFAITVTYQFLPDFGKGMRTLTAWDLEDRSPLNTLDEEFGDRPYHRDVCLLPKRRWVLSAVNRGNRLALWDLLTGAEIIRLEGGGSRITTLIPMPNSTRVASASEDNIIRLWDLETSSLLHMLTGHKNKVTTMSVTPEGTYLMSGDETGQAFVWSVETGECMARFTADGALETSVCTPNGRAFILGDTLGRVHILHPRGF